MRAHRRDGVGNAEPTRDNREGDGDGMAIDGDNNPPRAGLDRFAIGPMLVSPVRVGDCYPCRAFTIRQHRDYRASKGAAVTSMQEEAKRLSSCPKSPHRIKRLDCTSNLARTGNSNDITTSADPRTPSRPLAAELIVRFKHQSASRFQRSSDPAIQRCARCAALHALRASVARLALRAARCHSRHTRRRAAAPGTNLVTRPPITQVSIAPCISCPNAHCDCSTTSSLPNGKHGFTATSSSPVPMPRACPAPPGSLSVPARPPFSAAL